jgi:hypothetical protein
MSGAHSVARDGFQELVAAVGLHKVGIVLGLEGWPRFPGPGPRGPPSVPLHRLVRGWRAAVTRRRRLGSSRSGARPDSPHPNPLSCPSLKGRCLCQTAMPSRCNIGTFISTHPSRSAAMFRLTAITDRITVTALNSIQSSDDSARPRLCRPDGFRPGLPGLSSHRLSARCDRADDHFRAPRQHSRWRAAAGIDAFRLADDHGACDGAPMPIKSASP